MNDTSEDHNPLAFQHFYLLPIKATADPETAELVVPRVLGFVFLIAMSIGLCYTLYFITR